MSYVQQHKDGVLLSIRLQPRASRDEIGELLGNELKIKVTAPPVDSAANQALVGLLAELLDCPKSAIQIVRGATSRHKQVLITGVSAAVVEQKLWAGRK